MRKYAGGFIVAILFLIVGVATLPQYGMNWDGPHRMLRGHAFAQYLLTGKASYNLPDRMSPDLIRPGERVSRYIINAAESGADMAVLPTRPLPRAEFEKQEEELGRRLSFYQHEAWNGAYFNAQDDPAHPPLPEIMGAIFNRVLFQRWGLFGDVESFNLFYVLVASIGVLLTAVFAQDLTGSRFAGFVAGLSIALFPLWIGDSHINMKDPIQATFFAGSLWAFWHWVKENRMRWAFIYIGFLMLAAGVKWNFLVQPVILFPWLFLIRKTHVFREWLRPMRLGIFVLVAIAAISFFVIAIWPYLWTDPVGRFLQVVGFYGSFGFNLRYRIQAPGFVLPFGFNSYPTLLLFTQTPEIILLLGLLAIILKPRQDKEHMGTVALLLLWILVPLVRVTIPNATFYGGLRQIMEVIPALAILAGIGAYRLIGRVNIPMQRVMKVCIVIPFILLLYVLIQYHPNENYYFNALAGGFSGAAKKHLVDWTISYGNVYRQALNWLNVNVPEGANLAHLDGPAFAASPLWLRPDISVSPYHFSGFRQQGEYAFDLYNPLDPPVFGHRYLSRYLKPVHQIMVDGIPAISIYKNEAGFATADYLGTQREAQFQIQKMNDPGGDWWKVDLGHNVPVTRITLRGAAPGCLTYMGHDVIGLIPEEKQNDTFAIEDFYSLQEGKEGEHGQVELFFPAEIARYIVMFPQSKNACTAQGTIVSIQYLEKEKK